MAHSPPVVVHLLQIGAVSGKWADAASIELPVWTPATSEAFATYGTIDKGAIAQPVRTPGEVWPQFGGLEITTSSTALQALTESRQSELLWVSGKR